MVFTNYEPGQTTDFEFSYGLTRDSYLKTEVLRLDGSISCFAVFLYKTSGLKLLLLELCLVAFL